LGCPPVEGVYEVEAKVAVQDLAGVRERLVAAGGTCAGSSVEHDTFFQHPVRDFAATDEALRMRDRDGELELTYKGPRLVADAKVREEWNVPVNADPTPLLAALGFEAGVMLRKHRESWSLPGGVHVSLDTLEGLGTFVEVEVVAEDPVAAAAQVARWLDGLGLAGLPQTIDSYLEMALRAGAAAVQAKE
jgi:adenylate cyclase, class 2